MTVRVIGDGPAAAILVGILRAEQQEVVWAPGADGRLKILRRRKEIRLILPWGWLQAGGFRLSSSRLLKTGELGVAVRQPSGRGGVPPSQGAVGGRNKSLLALDHPHEPAAGGGLKRSVVPGTAVVHGLSLFDAVEWDPGVVEVSSPRPTLIVESAAVLQPLFRCLEARKIAVTEVKDLDPFRNALHIRDLLALPVALCHSTPGNFLSYAEGREIAVSLLEEGLQLYAHAGLPLAKLPSRDPRDLLQRLKRKPGEFDKGRTAPDRAFGRALRCILDGEAKAAREPHDRIVRMAAQTGIDPGWNWAIGQKVNHAIRVGFFRDPVELYKALR
jgi:hypothetical protein